MGNNSSKQHEKQQPMFVMLSAPTIPQPHNNKSNNTQDGKGKYIFYIIYFLICLIPLFVLLPVFTKIKKKKLKIEQKIWNYAILILHIISIIIYFIIFIINYNCLQGNNCINWKTVFSYILLLGICAGIINWGILELKKIYIGKNPDNYEKLEKILTTDDFEMWKNLDFLRWYIFILPICSFIVYSCYKIYNITFKKKQK